MNVNVDCLVIVGICPSTFKSLLFHALHTVHNYIHIFKSLLFHALNTVHNYIHIFKSLLFRALHTVHVTYTLATMIV